MTLGRVVYSEDATLGSKGKCSPAAIIKVKRNSIHKYYLMSGPEGLLQMQAPNESCNYAATEVTCIFAALAK
jgi:hypothetical protein